MKRLFILLAFLLTIIGCTKAIPMTHISTTPITPTQLAVPAGSYSGLAWLDQGLVLQARTTSNPVENLYWIDQYGNLDDPLSIPLEQSFIMTSYYFPQRLPNGKLGLRRYNWTPNLKTGAADREFGLWQFDPTTNALTPLLQPAMPQDLSQHLRFSLAPDMQRAILSDGGYLQSRLFWWSADTGHEPLDAGLGICQYVAWSPDGATIALIGSPDTAGSFGGLRNIRSNLYLMDSDGSNRREIGTKLRGIAGLQWSPDGRWLVVICYFDGFDNQIWLVNPTTAEWRQLTNTVGDYQWPAWSPDGTQIAVIWRKPAEFAPNDYVITVDVSGFVK
ncbi:TolB family protein [Herpetosiphon sp. NSE202]|uniref:TolB family protein n=1 Tax=Herpetosiphon sp. NSE202 TaxID=3351349 RepID=UPI0036355FE2